MARKRLRFATFEASSNIERNRYSDNSEENKVQRVFVREGINSHRVVGFKVNV